MEQFIFYINFLNSDSVKLVKRLDLYLLEVLGGRGISRSYIGKLVRNGSVKVNGDKKKAGYRIREGDKIEVKISSPKKLVLEAEKIPLDIIFEDKFIIVLNKPAGIVVHPGAGISHGTLVNALLYHTKDLSGINGVIRPGIVHRLDKTTSGILLIAKNDIAHSHLSKQFQNHTIKKEYLAIVQGNIIPTTGLINYSIGRNRKSRYKMAVTEHRGREAETEYLLEERFIGFDLVRLFPRHGRTHQIRVHLSYYGNPVIGDKTYGHGYENQIKTPEIRQAINSLKGNALHAHRITFFHPKTNEILFFQAPIPDDINKLIEILRHNK